MKSYLFSFFLFISSTLAFAQGPSRKREISFSLLNNAVAMPFSGKAGIIHKPLHPGFTAGYGKQINQHQTHQLLLSYKLGYVFQQRVQHAVHLYPELGYRLKTNFGVSLETRLGLGYMHSFTHPEQFKLNSDGEYERFGRGGRPSALASFSLGVGYDFEKALTVPLSVFTQYQIWFQSPYVRSYVPVLPNSALHLGFMYSFNKK